MKTVIIISFTVLIVVSAIWIAFSWNTAPTIPLTIGEVTIEVEVADTDAKRGRGLGGRRWLSKNKGMLYVFDEQHYHTFSMKDMRFPVDIIWINKKKEIVDVMKNAEPDSYPEFAFINDFPAMYVLEVNAGFFDKHNLELRELVEFSLEDTKATE